MRKPANDRHTATIGLDTGKDVFQVHAIDKAGDLVATRKLPRGEVLSWFSKQRKCLVGMEATGACHYWARSLAAQGHEVRVMPSRYVKPFRKTHKNDPADAEAIAVAVRQPTMRFVQPKTKVQQAELMLHRARQAIRLNRYSAHP